MYGPRSIVGRRSWRHRLTVVIVGALTVGALMVVAPVGGDPVAGAAEARAITVAAIPTVGPLFTDGSTTEHTCTASVLGQGSGLLLTAAHCVQGNGVGMTFVPGYDGTASRAEPYGVWTVDQAWLPPLWVADQDPRYDYAILQVSDNVVKGRFISLSDLVKGNQIGVAATLPASVTVPAYVAGSGDAPISCTAPTAIEQGFPRFDCDGYQNGSSGSPWINETGSTATTSVDAVIGGLHQGGCTASTSYSSAFDLDVYVLQIRAMLFLPGDVAPAAGADGC